MRYQLNLYREREARAVVVRRGILRGSILGVVVGIEALLIGLLAVSGAQLEERVRDMRASVAHLESRAGQVPDTAEVQLARKIVEARLARTDWASMMETLSRTLPRDLILTRIDGGTGLRRGSLNGLDLEGRTVGSTDLGPVIAFMNALRDSARVRERFPFVDLGTAGSQGSQEFKIICRPSTGKPEPAAAPEVLP